VWDSNADAKIPNKWFEVIQRSPSNDCLRDSSENCIPSRQAAGAMPFVGAQLVQRVARAALNKLVLVIPAKAGIHCKQQHGPQLSLG
jgi:hypothetical protein